MKRGLAGACGVLAIVLLPAACGGGGASARVSGRQYRADLKRASRELATAAFAGWPRYKGLLVAYPPSGTFARMAGGDVGADRTVADELASVKPPADAAADHEKLVAGLRAEARTQTMERAFARLVGTSSSPAAFTKAERRMSAVEARLRRDGTTAAAQGFATAVSDLQRRGYWPRTHRYIVALGSVGSPPRSRCGAAPEVIPPPVEDDSESAALKELRKYGFTAAVTNAPSARFGRGVVSGEQPQPACVGQKITVVVSTGKRGLRSTAKKHAAAPKAVAFRLVSRAGSQKAVHMRATFCKGKTDANLSCGFSWSGTQSFRVARLSVVRPGETVQFVLPSRPAAPPVPAPDRAPVALIDVYKDCNLPFPAASKPLYAPRWRVGLSPGRYVVVFGYFARVHGRWATEVGAVGMAVSRSRSLKIVPAAPCS